MLCILLLCLFLCAKVGKREKLLRGTQKCAYLHTQHIILSVPSPFTTTLNAYTMHILFVLFYVIFLSKSESAFDDDDIPLKKKTRSSYCIITWLPSFSFQFLLFVDSLSLSLAICVRASSPKINQFSFTPLCICSCCVFNIFFDAVAEICLDSCCRSWGCHDDDEFSQTRFLL